LSDNLRRLAVRGVFWSGVQQVSDRGLRMIVIGILAALVEPSAFGVVALAMVFIDGSGILLNQGLTAALVRRKHLTHSHKSSAFMANMFTAFVLVAALHLAAGPLAAWVGNADVESLLKWLAIGFVFTGLGSVQDAHLRREFRFRALAVRTLISRTAGAVLGVVLALHGHGTWSLVFMYLANQGVGALVLWVASPWRPSLRFSWTSYKELFDFGITMLGVEALNVTNDRGTDLIIGAMLGETALGFYALGRTLVGGIFALVNSSIRPVVSTAMSRLQDNRQKLVNAVEESTQLTAAVVLPLGAGVLLVAPTLVALLYGTHWLPALPIMYGLAISAMFMTISAHSRTALTVTGRVDVNLLFAGLGAILTLGAVMAGSKFELAGVAIGLVLAAAIQAPIGILYASRLLHLDTARLLLQLMPPVLLTSAMSLILFFLRPMFGADWLGLSLMASSGVLLYGLGSLIVAPALVGRIRTNLGCGRSGGRLPAR
jgi:O-antigen/teichoic acid export membrane protein